MCLTGDDGGGGDGLAGSVACVCVGADRLTNVAEMVVTDGCEGGDGSVGGDGGGDGLAGSVACVCVGAG